MPRREFPETPLVGVGAIVLRDREVLLIRRGQEPMKGEWSIPGGMLELGETLQKAVCREVLEETGLEVQVLALIDVFDKIVIDEPGSAADPNVLGAGIQPRIRYHYVLVDFLCTPIGGNLSFASDVEDGCWVAKDRWNLGDRYRLAPAIVQVIEKAFQLAARMQR
jgi:8-oxo-dGTP diphosphatase